MRGAERQRDVLVGRGAGLIGCPTMLHGKIHTLLIDSSVLAGNPLGDPTARELPVYVPPVDDPRGLPLILVLAGYTGIGAGQLRGTPWEPAFPERVERLLAAGKAEPAVFAFPDCFTRFGGSQYMNSSASGRYRDHLIEELIPRVEAEFGVGGERGRRGVIGKSSGGYGALHLCFEHPDVFSALASFRSRLLASRSLPCTRGPLIICSACERFDSFERSQAQAISRAGCPKTLRK